MTELIGSSVQQMPSGIGGGSEDFAFISRKVPTVGLFMAAGNVSEGYEHNIHNPKLKLDDSVLWAGSAAHAYIALRWLEEQS